MTKHHSENIPHTDNIPHTTSLTQHRMHNVSHCGNLRVQLTLWEPPCADLVAGTALCCLPRGGMYALASSGVGWAPAQISWQVQHFAACQGVGCTPWRRLASGGQRRRFRGRCSALVLAKGSDVRPGVVWRRLGTGADFVAGAVLWCLPRGRMYALASSGVVWAPAQISWQAQYFGACQGVGCTPWRRLASAGHRRRFRGRHSSDTVVEGQQHITHTHRAATRTTSHRTRSNITSDAQRLSLSPALSLSCGVFLFQMQLFPSFQSGIRFWLFCSPHCRVGFWFFWLHLLAPPTSLTQRTSLTTTSLTQHLSHNIPHTTSLTQHLSHNISHTTSLTQHPTHNISHATSLTQHLSQQHLTHNITHTTSHTQRLAHNITHTTSLTTTSRTQHHSHNIPHTTSRAQHHSHNISHNNISHTQHHSHNIPHTTSHRTSPTTQHLTSLTTSLAITSRTQHHSHNIPHTTSRTQHHSHNISHNNISHTTSLTQHPTHNISQNISNNTTSHITHNISHNNISHTTSLTQHPTHNVSHTTSLTQHLSQQHLTHNITHTTSHTQHLTEHLQQHNISHHSQHLSQYHLAHNITHATSHTQRLAHNISHPGVGCTPWRRLGTGALPVAFAVCGACCLPRGRMYALASAGHQRSAGGICMLCAALAACQGVGCTPWRRLGTSA